MPNEVLGMRIYVEVLGPRVTERERERGRKGRTLVARGSPRISLAL